MVGGREERAGLPMERGKTGKFRDSIPLPPFPGVCAAGEAFWFTRVPLFILVCSLSLFRGYVSLRICVFCVMRTAASTFFLNLPYGRWTSTYSTIIGYQYYHLLILILVSYCNVAILLVLILISILILILVLRGRELSIFPSLPGSLAEYGSTG